MTVHINKETGAIESNDNNQDHVAVVNSAEELCKALSIPTLRKLKKVLGNKVGAANMKKAELAQMLWDEMESVPTLEEEDENTVAPDTKPEDLIPETPKADEAPKADDKPVRITKASLLRSAFDEKVVWTRDELLKRTGYDKNNLTVALAILRNPKRTKEDQILRVKYDRVSKTYLLVD